MAEDFPTEDAPMVASESRWLPGRFLAPAAAIAVPAALVGGPVGIASGLAWDAALLVASRLEGRALGASIPSVRRELVGQCTVGATSTVRLYLRNTSGRALRGTIVDAPPSTWAAEEAVTLHFSIPPHGRKELSYEVLPERRGTFRFSPMTLRIEGRLGLAATQVTLDVRGEVRVFPDVLGPTNYDLAARKGLLRGLGFRNVRRIGGGGEFAQLRDYVAGDPYRGVDWKSTAKKLRPITRVYQREQSQQVVICVDASRLMGTAHDHKTKLDHALSAALLMAYVALSQGDRVGVVVFAHDVLRFVPPKRGRQHYQRILRAIFDVPVAERAVDYRRLVEFLRLRIPRRALLVLVTDLLDEGEAQTLVEQATALRRKHLALCLTMRDPSLAVALTGPEPSLRAAAIEIERDRRVLVQRLRSAAIDVAESPLAELSVLAVNQYLKVKATGRL